MIRMRPYSVDLRQNILQAYERGVGTQAQVAELFGGSISLVEKLFMQKRRTGASAPKRIPAGGPRALMLMHSSICANG
jgi:transposase